MKVKPKLDGKGLQAFAFQNVEKVGFGIVALIGLFMVYRAVGGGIERYQRAPEQLTQEVTKSRGLIDAGRDKAPPEPKDYVTLAKQSRVPIADTPYETALSWNPEIFERKKLREKPVLYAAQQLRGAAELGAMNMMVETKAMAAGAGGAVAGQAAVQQNETRLQRWVVLTAVVPSTNQQKAYDEALKKSQYPDPQNDWPQYYDYTVERLEVPGPSEATSLDWSKAKRFAFYDEVEKTTQRWPQQSTTEVVDPQCVDEGLTFPLGSLLSRQWGETAAHAPEIPVLDPNDPRTRGMMGPVMGGHVGGMGPGMGPAMGPGMGPAMGPAMGPGMGPAMGPGMAPGPGMGPGALGRNRGVVGGAMGPMGGAAGRLPRARRPRGEAESKTDKDKDAEEPVVATLKLLRYFDFSVEPGKCYVYRVRLTLVNPNYVPTGAAAANAQTPCNIKPSYLTDPKDAEKEFLETEWSEPSPVISTPPDTRTLAISVTPAREPSAKVMLARWVQRGFEAFDDFNLVRGQLANFTNVTITHEEAGAFGGMGMMGPGAGPMLGGPGPMGGGAQPRAEAAAGAPDAGAAAGGRRGARARAGGGAAGAAVAPGPGPGIAGGAPLGGGAKAAAPMGMGRKYKLDFYSNIVAIDFRGGDKVSRRTNMFAPGQVLLWEPDGTLSVHDQIEDKPAVDALRESESAHSQGDVGGARRGGGALDNLPH